MYRLRIDKWLWAARFYKTRSLASDEIDKGRVAINGQEVKPAREVKVGDTVSMRREGLTRTVVVKGVSDMRGPAPVAQQMFEETAESVQERVATHGDYPGGGSGRGEREVAGERETAGTEVAGTGASRLSGPAC